MKNYNVLVTGGSGGIGKEVVNLFEENNYKVFAPRSKEMNLMKKDSIFKYIKSFNIDIDILINCAGINPLAGILEIEDEDIYKVLEINFISNIRLIKAVLPSMIKNKFGRIINFSSIWSVVTKEKRLIYSASKSAINSITRNIALEVSRYNILINSIAPGYVRTPLTEQNNSKEEIERIAKNIPIGRLAKPSEIAQLAIFLASSKNSYITGQTIIIDGGYTCL